MIRVVVTILVVFSLSRSFSQERISVKDPEIEFSIDLPKGWTTKNDDYYFFVFNPEWKQAQLTITYFNENTPRELEEIVDTRLNFSYPNLPGYRFVSDKHETISGVDAYSVRFLTSDEGTRLENVEYIFIKNGQIFYLQVTSVLGEFEKRFPDFQTVVESFDCKYR